MKSALLWLAMMLASLPVAAQACWPGLACSGEVIGLPGWARGAQAWHAWWFWRPAATAPVRLKYLLCTHASGGCTAWAAQLGPIAQACKAATDPGACAAAEWSQRVAWQCSAADTAGAPDRLAACAEARTLWVADAKARKIEWPPTVWVVSRVGMATTATTRPVYPFAAGVRGATAGSGVRATIGAACDCSVRSVEGISNYCAHDAARTTVTLCRAS